MDPLRLLIVDDEAKLVNTLKGFLELKGYQVWTATRGEDAVNLMQTCKPDVLLLDMRLEESQVQGLDLLREAKRLLPATRVIMFTGYSEEDKKQEAFRLGAAGFLEKPVMLPDVLKAVQAAAGDRGVS